MNGLEAVIVTNNDDQHQPPISTSAPMNVVAPARLGLKLIPEELDDYSDEYKEWEATVLLSSCQFFIT
ncbi:hypothetical protein F2Q69_00019318 [Brassica cretica]|uniref:Uncharacterized protein n=1 Tax=Brassica cretica TaxID=69181 RepID=A0A8S9QFT7_BRACR|nr:hypothetical protein F2Q69_00019318 [Brassica cretica]